ncbi:MAG: PEP-CTERM sorting domain-containing protein [Gemmatimonadaceae bacterium]|nr:PEP-CTERM sorting domain-containing protein [Gemmatimonadaceae bacterium]
MFRRLCFAAALLVSANVVSAQPTATLSGGYTFVDWLTVNNATVGAGAVDDRVVYYLQEKQIGDLQSWLIFFDPSGTQSVNGTITFGETINSIYTSSDDVNVNKALYRLTPTVTYAGVALTGLEQDDAASFAGNTLSIDWTASDPGDHIRVLTNVVPEPSTYALMALGLAAMGAVSRRTRRRA